MHPLVYDFLVTSGVEITVLVTGFAIISIFGRLLGAVALGEYLLLKRLLSWLQTGSQLGLGVALPRYVAHAVKATNQERESHLSVSLVLILAASLSIGIVLVSARTFFATVLFGEPGAANLMFALALILSGIGAHTAVYGYYRGILAMERANALQLWNLVVVPIVAVVALRHTGSVVWIVSLTGAAVLVSSMAAAFPIFVRTPRTICSMIRPLGTQLLQYGIPRVPGDFALAALFAVSPVIASHLAPMRKVAYLLVGISILSAIGTAATPVGTLMLSKVSMMLAEGRRHEVRAHLEQCVSAVIEVSVFVCLQLAIFADVAVRLWLGGEFNSGMIEIRILVLAAPLYLLYATLRSWIDAASPIAYNARNICLAFGAFAVAVSGVIVLLPVQYLLPGIASVLLLAFAILAVLSVRSAKRLFHLNIPWNQSAGPLILAVLLASGSLALRQIPETSHLLPALILVGTTSVIFLGVSNRVGSAWLPFFLRLAFPTRDSAPAAYIEHRQEFYGNRRLAAKGAAELSPVGSSWPSSRDTK